MPQPPNAVSVPDRPGRLRFATGVRARRLGTDLAEPAEGVTHEACHGLSQSMFHQLFEAGEDCDLLSEICTVISTSVFCRRTCFIKSLIRNADVRVLVFTF